MTPPPPPENASDNGTALVKTEVATLGIDQVTGAPVVVLREKGGERILPIWIGHGEASAIAFEMAGVKASRPLTQDLLVSIIDGLRASLVRVQIPRVKKDTFYAAMVLRSEHGVSELDCRPSDGIAAALKAGSPIYVADRLLGHVMPELSPAPSVLDEDEPGKRESLSEYIQRLSPEDLGRFDP
ncbi:MAG: bifunctional nuclease family protein [Gemmatimonadetes bacterium]|nr:bifunctional nuclease family protein [Gemmatimonadota bacterium]